MNHFASIFVMLILFLNQAFPQNRSQIDSLKDKFRGVQPVSLIALISNPEQFQGKQIQVAGYLHLKFEDAAIYFTKDDADHLRGCNSFWVRFAEKVNHIPSDIGSEISYFDCKYVVIRGVFNRENTGHLGAFAGAIENIDYISEERQWYDGRRELWEHKLNGKGLVPKK